MAYVTYTTEAIVCGSYDSNSSDRSYLLFTHDAGMLYASARSVREERSKQRFALQDFSVIRVSLVKGKSGWRIGSVEAVHNPFLHASSRQQRGIVSYVVKQLRRYVHGDTPIPEIYADAQAVLMHTSDPHVIDDIQTVFTLRLLSRLGYVSRTPDIMDVLETPDIMDVIAELDARHTPKLQQLIEQATHASQL